MEKQEILELLRHTEQELLFSFVAEYAAEDKRFCEQLKDALLPANDKAGGKDEDREAENDNTAASGDTNAAADNAEIISALKFYRGQAEDCFFLGGQSQRSRYYDDDYGAALTAASELEEMLEEASEMVAEENFADAAAIAMAVIETIPRNYEDVDDYDGELGEKLDRASALLCNILNNPQVSVSVKKGIFEWRSGEAGNASYSVCGYDEIKTIHELCCDMLGDASEALAGINRQIDEAVNEYARNKAVLRKIRFMQFRNRYSAICIRLAVSPFAR
jgi:hypothetical protein